LRKQLVGEINYIKDWQRRINTTSGTKAGGLKAARKNIELHGKDFYRIIGSKGGQKGHTGGFAADRELARAAGAKGGRMSRRTGVPNGQGKKEEKEYIYKGGLDEETVFA
jgi:hypothetical protein